MRDIISNELILAIKDQLQINWNGSMGLAI